MLMHIAHPSLSLKMVTLHARYFHLATCSALPPQIESTLARFSVLIASNKYAAAVVDVDLNIGIGWIGKAFDMVHKFDIAAAATWITV